MQEILSIEKISQLILRIFEVLEKFKQVSTTMLFVVDL